MSPNAKSSRFSILALITAVSLAGAALRPSRALADDSAPAPAGYATMPAPTVAQDAAPTTETHWYGWQMLALDAASLTALVLAPNLDDEDLYAGVTTAALGAFVLGPAIIHGQHGHMNRAVGSVALRVGLPLAGGFIGNATCDEAEHEDELFGCLGSMFAGAMLGSITAMFLDDFVLGMETRAVPARAPRFQLGLAPRSDSGMTLSLGGSF